LLNYLGCSLLWNVCNPHFWRAVKSELTPLYEAGSPAVIPAALQQLFMIIPGPFFWAVVLMKAFDISAFVDDGALAAVSILFIGYGVALIPFCYLASIPFTKHWSAQIYIVLFCIFVGLILMIAAFVM
jgi:hypothetical protein